MICTPKVRHFWGAYQVVMGNYYNGISELRFPTKERLANFSRESFLFSR